MPHQAVPPAKRAFARTMRREATGAEDRLWQELRGRRLGGIKFRRQRRYTFSHKGKRERRQAPLPHAINRVHVTLACHHLSASRVEKRPRFSTPSKPPV